MNKMTVRDIPIKGKKILISVDFNVPLDKKTREIMDDTRITAALPTIEYILKQDPKKLILMTHLGRPDGKVIAKFSLMPCADVLKRRYTADPASSRRKRRDENTGGSRSES